MPTRLWGGSAWIVGCNVRADSGGLQRWSGRRRIAIVCVLANTVLFSTPSISLVSATLRPIASSNIRLRNVWGRPSKLVSGFLVSELQYSSAKRTNVQVYWNGVLSKFGPVSNQRSHARTFPTDSERHTMIRIHHFIAGWALEGFPCVSGFFRRSFQMLVEMIV